jgi:hypothetical protein
MNANKIGYYLIGVLIGSFILLPIFSYIFNNIILLMIVFYTALIILFIYFILIIFKKRENFQKEELIKPENIGKMKFLFKLQEQRTNNEISYDYLIIDYNESLSESDNPSLILRYCWKCGKEIYFMEAINSKYNRDMKLKVFISIWVNPSIQVFCCDCYSRKIRKERCTDLV